MVEERKSIHTQALQSRKVLETIAKPFCVWSSIYLCVCWRKLQGVCQFSYGWSHVWQDPLESCQGNCTILVHGDA
jgi:hypothetical protein